MKLTVAALALLVAGASYADMAAAMACWSFQAGGGSIQALKDCENFAKPRGLVCKEEPDNIRNPPGREYCAVQPPAPPAPPAPPVPPTPHDGKCFYGAKAEEDCDKYVAKHHPVGMECKVSASTLSPPPYCLVPTSAPPAPPAPPSMN